MKEEKKLEEVIKAIKSKYGEGSIMRLTGGGITKVDVIPTGSFSLDMALGIGGFPRGRIVEIFGPEGGGKSTLALHTIAESQKMGGNVAYIDAEHSLDPEYAKRIGVKVEDVLISQPNSGEEALNILESLIRSGTIDVIVVDSVAALTPQAEIEGEMADVQIGLQARLMSKALRKIASIVAKTNTLVIFINQIRMKIGMMFGCFSYDSLVLLADGSKEKIGKIVNQRQSVKVRSYNFEKQRIENHPVVDWHINGETGEFLQFFIQNHTGNGRRGFSCTPEHKIYTTQGWKKAKELRVGDEIMVLTEQEKLTAVQEQILLGSVMGDGNIKKQHEQTAYFREEHGAKQASYVKWLGEVLGNLISNIHLKTKRNTAIIESRTLLFFGNLWKKFYSRGKKIVSEEIISYLTPRALAAWYCGDGSLQTGYSWWKGKRYNRRPRAALYINGFDDQVSRENIKRIFSRFGIKPTLRKVENTHALQFSVSESLKLFKLIAPYIPPSMAYKLPPEYRDKYKHLFSQKTNKIEVLKPMKIKAIKKRVPYQDGQRISRRRFDITVAKNHNYFVDGCLVSNSPETTPGGRALKFYTSVRVDIRPSAKIKKGDQIIGHRVSAKIVKNKLAPPFKKCEFDIIYGQGISYVSDIITVGLKTGVLRKSGNTYYFGDNKLGVGAEKSKEYLKENPEVVEKIKERILEIGNN